MASGARMTLPCFDQDELAILRDLDTTLNRHPYMRADLGARDAASKELEAVVSARLAWLHTHGMPAEHGKGASLLDKLRGREKELALAITGRRGSEETALRYETSLLLHPDPRIRHDGGTVSTRLTEAVERWERLRSKTPGREVLAQKCRQSLDFFRHGAMLPFYWTRRRRIRACLPPALLARPALRRTFFAIEQVGPLVDNFAFRGAGGIPRSTAVALADVAFLYMQLADELLDELAVATGGHDAAGRLVRSLYRECADDRPLRELSLAHVRSIGVDPDGHRTKFDLTLSELFHVLDELGQSIDSLLFEAEPAVVGATHLFLHHCFQTYLDEVALCETACGGRADRMRLQDAAWHFYRKNNLVMMLWLDLRARLLGLDPADHADAIRRWGYLLASFQIFDDLKDVAMDLGRQPSYALQIAANDFPPEFAWIEARFGSRRAPVSRDEVPEVSIHARKTVQQCMRWSRLIALAHFDNVLLYAWDQRWRKSWTERRNSFNPGDEARSDAGPHAVDRLVCALQSMRHDDASFVLDDEQLAFALDAAAYEGSWQIYLALFPNLRAMYRFATLRMWMTAEEKARAARRLLRRFPPARASALPRLGHGDVDHQIASDGLETFSQVIEA